MPLPATWRSWLNWIGCSPAMRSVSFLLLTFAGALHIFLVAGRGPRRLLRRVGAPGRVLLEPLDLGVQLEQLVTQLAPPVRLPRRDVQMCRHVEALQRAVHLDRLRH